MSQSQYSKSDIQRAILTVENIDDTISTLIDWNVSVTSIASYYSSQQGMQLLAANCTLITAIGEGIGRINRILPDFLSSNFPEVPWKAIIGMRNHIAHGYFELDADIVFESVKNDIPELKSKIGKVLRQLREMILE